MKCLASRSLILLAVFVFVPGLGACGDDSARDAAVADSAMADSQVDAAPDGGADAAPDSQADAAADAGASLGFGHIAGPCAMITGEVTSPSPSYFLNRLDFADDPFDDPEDLPFLTDGGREILAEGTAGGSSGVSEAFAYEVLARCEGASLLKTETEIVYTGTGKITDMLVEIDGIKVGVSVTRAFVFPATDPFTVAIARERLTDKLSDVLLSSAQVAPEDAWVKQILVIMAYGEMHAASLMTAWGALDAAVTADTIVYVVITDGMDEPVY